MGYQEEYRESIEQPEQFWRRQAEQIAWYEFPQSILTQNERGYHCWFQGGKLNSSYLALDHHVEAGRGGQLALIYDSPVTDSQRKFTFTELRDEVAKFAGVLRAQGVEQGDRVIIYMPMIPEAAVAMLACARLGAVHSVVFGGFSPEALKERINDSECCVLITADQSVRGGKKVPLKTNADKACKSTPSIQKVIVVQRGGDPVEWQEVRDVWYHEAMASASVDCPAEAMDAEDPLFILY
ncbi:MAG TPA: acetyl-coenzyme A synthetase, partial [Deltaproteobacteria bacterium]|nr:acetyl-coenzyme A synthetase [Deltaproteobacteria bacterium]